jgi:uncharacterized protein
MSIERRYIQELRAGQGQGDQMVLEGYAARFNSPSKDLGGFRETIAPGAFKRALAENADVRCLFNHSADKVLGRTASGTLTINEDEKGLHFRCQLDPNNTDHRNLHSSVKRGDINECSFAFTPNGPDGEDWQNVKDERGNWFISRMLKDVNLFDVSAVTHPAYDNTSVQARAAEILTVEVRSHISDALQKRAAMLGTTEKRTKSVQDMLNCISQCLQAQFPRTYEDGTNCPSGYGLYWVCDTYDDYVVASKDCAGPSEYYKITYVPKPDGDGYVFGEPQPVEKEWVPSERSKSVAGEQRAFTSAHMQAIADAHKETAAQHTDVAAEHTAAADEHTAHAEAHDAAAASAQKEADRMEKCSGTMGDCGIKGCTCQNQMVSARDMEDDYEDYDGSEDEADEEKTRRRSLRKATEVRADGSDKVRTKTVGGKALPMGAFAHVGDPNDTSTWKLPVHDKAHADNAAARLNQTNDIPADKKAAVEAKIKAAQKKFGETPDEARAFTEEMELRFRLAMAL